MTVLLLNHENAMLQPALTAKRTIASLFQIPLDWILMEWAASRDARAPTLQTDVIPPPDGRDTYPNARYFALSPAERTEVVARTLKAAADDRNERFAELTELRRRGL